MRFDVLTLFPEVFGPYFEASILGRAREQRLLETRVHDLREFTDDRHRTVDDTPYGGGAGMILKIEPIARALGSLVLSPPDKEDVGSLNADDETPSGSPLSGGRTRTVVLSARGEQFTQVKAAEYAKLDQVVLICGRYEGVDQRVADYLADEEISIGPYVLAGGEIAALAVVEATARLVPGVLGNPESLVEESFGMGSPPDKGGVGGLNADDQTSSGSPLSGGGTVEYPHYTKPEEFKGWRVPEVLLSGDHAKIKQWRDAHRRREKS